MYFALRILCHILCEEVKKLFGDFKMPKTQFACVSFPFWVRLCRGRVGKIPLLVLFEYDFMTDEVAHWSSLGSVLKYLKDL
ncbi:hypothetical protein [Helicobacter sp. UBA3407]|uniref:hypothetical protein n=1 Tax=Helicobacter TaxID=209 RepID=UPI002608AC64|nr:hypothetical protein [Helicobacter sp. UBA3407]